MATLNLRRFTDPDALNSITPARLSAFLKPWEAFLCARGFNFPQADHKIWDCDTLAHILIAPGGDAPKDMIDAFYYVHETSTDEDMDALIDAAKTCKIPIERNLLTTPADVAIQIWLADPDMLRDRHAETIAFRQKNFLYYGGGKRAPPSFPKIDDDLRRNIENALDDWFQEHNRGRACRVLLFPHKKKVWILIRHGLPPRREASHREDGKSATEFYRPQQHDVLIYDTGSDEIGVHANTKGETKLYLRCLGKLVFGDENYFPPADKFTLEPLILKGSESLLCEDVEGLEKASIVEYRRYWGGQCKEIEIRKATDIFMSFAKRNQTIGNAGRLMSAKFKLKFSDSPKERSVTIRPPGNAIYERNEDSEMVEVWLKKRGFICKSTGDGDDEAPTEVMEGVGGAPGSDDGPTGVAPAAG